MEVLDLYLYFHIHSAVGFDADPHLYQQKWRKDSGVDQILEKPLDREEQFFKMYPHDFHGYSKTGYPVYIEDSCFSDPSKLLEEFPVEEQQRFHIQMMEMLAALYGFTLSLFFQL